MPERSFDSPVARISVVEKDGAITRLYWGGAGDDDTALLRQAGEQLSAYFARELEVFDLPLRVEGSDFQRAVCAAMSAISFGETRTYGEIAADLNVPPQPVGQACGGNPIPIIIPCHRVLSATGLGGFSGDGGVESKVTLLRHEGAAGLLL